MNSATVLIVDDDPDLRDAVSVALELIGYGAFTASNGAEALGILEKTLPDVILLDMKMPVMDGWEFARRAQERFGGRLPPILVLTAAENPAARASEINAQGWLGKPFDVDELRAQVDRCLTLRNSAVAPI